MSEATRNLQLSTPDGINRNTSFQVNNLWQNTTKKNPSPITNLVITSHFKRTVVYLNQKKMIIRPRAPEELYDRSWSGLKDDF